MSSGQFSYSSLGSWTDDVQYLIVMRYEAGALAQVWLNGTEEASDSVSNNASGSNSMISEN